MCAHNSGSGDARTAARAAAVDPVGVLDLVRPTRQTAHVHVTSDRATARLDLHHVSGPTLFHNYT